jgi:DNA-binding response OmpR family regulator
MTTMKILVVDDNVDSAESLALLLSMNGHQTQVAHDGLEALAVAETFRPDVMLLDLGLPKLDGLEVCRQLRRTDWGRAVSIVALTGFGQDSDRLEVERAGFDRHLLKPIDYDQLLGTLGTLLLPRS